MAILHKRSTTEATPPSLIEGQQAYSFVSNNLFIGGPENTVIKIGGNSDVAKLAGIEAGAQVNDVLNVAGRTGEVVITTNDLADFDSAADARIAVADIEDLANVGGSAPSNSQVLTWVTANNRYEPQTSGLGATEFIGLNDTPVNYTSSANYYLQVNGAANAIQFTQHIDDGIF